MLPTLFRAFIHVQLFLGPIIDAIYCNATCDGFLCWPPTLAGETLFQYCPKLLLSNQNKCAYRRCGAEGLWLGRHLNDSKGWTNYTPCFPPLVQKILDKVNEDEAEAQFKYETAMNTRTIEMVGIVSSWLCIFVSLIIFHTLRSLRNRRIEIHKNLFCALLMEESVRWILYTQQSYSFDDSDSGNSRRGIEYFPYVCEGAYILLEYSRLVVYAWMFIEGIFLHSLISVNSLRNEIPIKYFYVGGWGGPVVLTAIWATIVGRHYAKEPVYTCWYGYNYLLSYYIIQAPILMVIAVNMVFLGTIMSVIIMKLRRTNDSELRKIQKTLRATIILLPLLGIMNIFNLFDYPINGSSTGFAVWAYFTHFFRSFQGVFISFIYCFLNAEVRKAISKRIERRTWCRYAWMERRRRPQPKRVPEPPIFAIVEQENMELLPMPVRTWTEPLSTHNVSDVKDTPIDSDDMGDRDLGRRRLPQCPTGRSRSLPSHQIPDIHEPGPSRMGAVSFHENADIVNRHRAPLDRRTSRPHIRTVAVELPADDQPGSHVHISIQRSHSADAAGVQELITVRRSSADSPGDQEPITVRRSSTPCYPLAPHQCALAYIDLGQVPATAPFHRVTCPDYRNDGPNDTFAIPPIPPPPPPPAVRDTDSDSSVVTPCGCSCWPITRARSLDRRPTQDRLDARLAVGFGTEYEPNRVRPAKLNPKGATMVKELKRKTLPENRGVNSQTMPRLGRREPFVRPGLVTRANRSQSLNCI